MGGLRVSLAPLEPEGKAGEGKKWEGIGGMLEPAAALLRRSMQLHGQPEQKRGSLDVKGLPIGIRSVLRRQMLESCIIISTHGLAAMTSA